MNKISMKNNARGRPKNTRKKHVFTYEILPPGSLKRKPPCTETPEDRWEDILDTCAEIIAENTANKQ